MATFSYGSEVTRIAGYDPASNMRLYWETESDVAEIAPPEFRKAEPRRRFHAGVIYVGSSWSSETNELH